MSTHNIRFYGEISKIIPKLSPNTLLICSTVLSYADVRCQRRKDMGLSDDVHPKLESELQMVRRPSRSPSVNSVTSGGKFYGSQAKDMEELLFICFCFCLRTHY